MRVAKCVMKENMIADRDFPNFALRDRIAKKDGDDVNHRAGDPADDETVHQKPEINGFESAEECRRLAGVAKLCQFDVGHDFGTTPIASEEKDSEHPGEALVPPEPVAGDALRGDQASDEQGSIRSKSGGDHGSAGEPPRNIAAGDEKLGCIAARTAAIVDADQKIDEEIADNDDPIGGSKGHGPLFWLLRSCYRAVGL